MTTRKPRDVAARVLFFAFRRLRLPRKIVRALPMLSRFVIASVSCAPAVAAAGTVVHNGTRYAIFTAAPADIELFCSVMTENRSASSAGCSTICRHARGQFAS